MKEILKIIKNYVQSAIYFMIEQKLGSGNGFITYLYRIHTEIELNQRIVKDVAKLTLYMYQNARVTVFVPMYAPQNQEKFQSGLETVKVNSRLALNKK